MRSLLALLVCVLGLVAGCGGGGDGGDPPPDPNAPERRGAGWVTIEAPQSSTYTTEESSIVISGTAFISPDTFRCCSGSPSDTGVNVSWSSSTGASGTTSQGVDYCTFFLGPPYLCDHTWSVRIALALGTNVIRVTASDGGRNSGSDGITITRNAERTPPTVVSTDPANGATNVPVNRSLRATFSEPMDNATITSATFTVRDGLGNVVPGTVTITDRTATFQPAAFLVGFTPHTATLSTGIRDTSGNALTAAHAWTFTTGNADLTPPQVLSISPAEGSACTPIDGEINVVFNEPMDSSSITELGIDPSFVLDDITGGPSQTFRISGEARVSTDGRSAVFDPKSSLGFSRLLRATLTTRARDLAGNNLPSGRTWSFSTRADSAGAGGWQAMSTVDAPTGVEGHSAIWTGSEMVIFGGMVGFDPTDQGARYAPTNDTWTALPGGGPSARARHVAVWTGTEMIVWGGSGPNESRLNDGARYNPVTNTWSAMSNIGAPSARRDATAVWTGSEMIVWGGLVDDHGAYNPATDTWRTLSNAGAPDPTRRAFHSAIWTGSRMIIWGGETNCSPGPCAVTTKGGSYDPSSDRWEPLGTSGEPGNRLAHTAVWTGTEMIVWGGHTDTSDFFYARGLNTGAAYDPATNSWRPVSTSCGPAGRYGHSAVWTGTDMIVWGGYSMGFNSRTFRTSGALYRPSSDSWQHMAPSGATSTTTLHSAVWDGSRVIVWGRSPAVYVP